MRSDIQEAMFILLAGLQRASSDLPTVSSIQKAIADSSTVS